MWGIDEDLIGRAEKKETEKLSEFKFESIYYEPKDIPSVKLEDCFDDRKYREKVEFINQLKLPEKTKEVLEVFARRFIKIDFESVANYYAFNASDEEKEAIERLRLVLVDGGINGFIEDDMLRMVRELAIEEEGV